MKNKNEVLVTRKLPDAVEARLKRDYQARFNADDRLYDKSDILSKCDECDAILASPTDKFDADLLVDLPNSVRIIATFSVGYEHIDLDAARERNIIVTNTPDVLTAATADIAMLLLLGAARRAYEAEQILRSRQWRTWETTSMLGTQVTGKRLGILGMGRIGRSMAQRARGFEMEVHYHDRIRLTPDEEQDALNSKRLSEPHHQLSYPAQY